jgi:hypothetical protein
MAAGRDLDPRTGDEATFAAAWAIVVSGVSWAALTIYGLHRVIEKEGNKLPAVEPAATAL